MKPLAEPHTHFVADLPEECDVVVVGGGIAGVCAAYHLAAAGVRTVVLERGRLGSGATGSAVGVLSPPLRQPFDEMVHFRGVEVARAVWEFALRSVAGLGALLEARGEAARAGLDLSGGYVLADVPSLHQVESAFKALHEARLPVEWLSGEKLRSVTKGRGFVGGYRIEGGGCLSPAPTVRILAEAAEEAGARFVEGVDVDDVRRSEGRLVCDTARGQVKAEMVVYATHVDTRRFSAFVGDEVVPIRGQAMMTEAGPPVFRGSFSTHWKLNVWRSDPDGRLLVGGWRHDAWDRSYWKTRPRVDEALQESLQGWFQSAFPEVGTLPVARRWSGIFGWTADYLPMVGTLPGRAGEMIISGFSGGGLPFAYEAGRAIAAMVTGEEPVPGSELLRPRRFT